MVALRPYRRPEPFDPDTPAAPGDGQAPALVAVPGTGERTRGPGGIEEHRSAGAGPGVLIIVQNLPVPFDRRVWLECQSLVKAGFDVAVICPKGTGDPSYQVLDGVRIYKYRSFAAKQGKLGYLAEFGVAFVATAWLTAKAWRRNRFDVLQACNPPDIFWPIALALRPAKVKFVFDHHDLCPELFSSRFGERSPGVQHTLRTLERRTFRAAHHVIATNESYRRVAVTGGSRRYDEVTVVRSGPDPERFRRRTPMPSLRRGRSHLVAYLGVMGPQDGVDLAVLAAHHVVHGLKRDDIGFIFMGSGDCYRRLVELTQSLGIAGHVEFTGRIPDDFVADVLSTADVGLCPDPRNALNDVSTMNKTLEYMAFSLPVVAFDLHETRVSAAGAAAYARPNEVEDFASRIVELIDDPARRAEMAAEGRTRIENALAWPTQAERYVGVYRKLTSRHRADLHPVVAARS